MQIMEQEIEENREMLVDALMEVILKPDDAFRKIDSLEGEAKSGSNAGQVTDHGAFLMQEVLPKQLVTYGCGIFRPFHFWCIGCDGDAVLDYTRQLETFRGSIPRFRYHLLVSDSDPVRMRDTRFQIEKSGGLIRPGGKIELRLESLERENLALRKPQDVIVCGQKLEPLVGGSIRHILGSLCKLLFPGRYLFGEEDFLGLYGELPLCPVEAGVFRRTG